MKTTHSIPHVSKFQQCLLVILLTLLPFHAISQNTKIAAPFLPAIPHNYSVDLPNHLRENSSQNFTTDANIATLGRVLFYDKRLSANNLVSCSSCHAQITGFDDPSRFSIGFKGLITKRSAMGLTNVRFNKNGKYFWDERANSLKEQVLQPFLDPIEMGLEKDTLIQIIAATPYYDELFQKAFASPQITLDKISTALATYLNAIVSTTSPFALARARAQNPAEEFPTFTPQQNRGKALFFKPPNNGGAGCSSCHLGEAMISPAGGENNGLGAGVFKDIGIAGITNNNDDRGKFRPPSLSNIGVRAPYMHDGRFENLEQVIDHYSTRVTLQPNLGAALKEISGNPRRFNFSISDKRALIAFLHTLTDDKLLRDPKFSDPFVH